jgi:hypothetical protein
MVRAADPRRLLPVQREVLERMAPSSSLAHRTVVRGCASNGVFASVDSLIEVIETWTEHWNDAPKPFVWTMIAEAILAKSRRARTALTASVRAATDHQLSDSRTPSVTG